ncbi:PREDICTED: 39S ribosomal protein L48, mitochondrial [Thamnophis sirtalis]|uniref:Large ribosomal subunit protein mL48 n=1 Tax=Thamnophis sirtalis TaxID=35019 RepID=A0A6I9Z0R5_9SAUR|nr:PREDICTED: 39S ribosomal protein L48, mitochondrial [Thamnophis sirtalis]
MSAALGKVLSLGKESVLKQGCGIFSLAFKSSRRNPICPLGSLQKNFQRHYRSKPTHGIGRYRHLLPPEAPPKRKNHVEMKEIDPGTEHQYGTLNIVMTGYDVCLVEHYAQYVHRLCNKLPVKVVESYAMPTKTVELVLAGEHGSKVRVDGHLTSHQRVVQINQLTATFSPIFLEIIQNNLPEGVHLLVKEHTEEDFRIRLKVRTELDVLRAKLQ